MIPPSGNEPDPPTPMKLPPLLSAAALALMAGAAPSARAALFSSTWNNVNLEVPDGPVSGDPVTVSDTRTINTGFAPGVSELADLSVWIRFSGSDGAGGAGTMWNGDLSVTLTHQSGATLSLLNRVGRDTGSVFGASGDGIDIHLDASALADVHLAGNGPLTGTYQPDGRSEDPSTVTTSSARDATVQTLMVSFGLVSPDGQWTLSVSDLESGGLARLDAWGLVLAVVPEPADYACIAGAGLVGFALWRRRQAA